MTGSVVLCTLIRRHFFYSEYRTAGLAETLVRICRPAPNEVADYSSLHRHRHELSHNAQLLLVKNYSINRLTPNDPYMGRTAQLTSKRCILYIYSTNIGTEYFKHAVCSPFFFSSKCSLFHNVNLFGSCIIHILYKECAKIKKK